MNYAPLARILLRYLTGISIGGAYLVSEKMAVDPDLVMIVAAGIGAMVETFYAIAKKRGWNT